MAAVAVAINWMAFVGYVCGKADSGHSFRVAQLLYDLRDDTPSGEVDSQFHGFIAHQNPLPD